jgi:hypothetical protein
VRERERERRATERLSATERMSEPSARERLSRTRDSITSSSFQSVVQ